MKQSIILIFVLLILQSVSLSAQQMDMRLVMRGGRYLYQEKDLPELDKRAIEFKTYRKKFEKQKDSLAKLGVMLMETDCAIAVIPTYRDSVNSGYQYYLEKVKKNLNLNEKIKIGENIIKVTLDENGLVMKTEIEKSTDRRTAKRIKNLIDDPNFSKFSAANFYGDKVGYEMWLSFIIDQDFSKYNLKNKYGNDTNVNELRSKHKS